MRQSQASLPAPPQALIRTSAFALLGLVFAAVLAISYPGGWALNVFQAGTYLLGLVWMALCLFRPFAWRMSVLLAPLTGAALWGVWQLAAGRTVNRFETCQGALAWGACLAIFLLSLQIFASAGMRSWLRRALLVFGFALSVVSVTQWFTSEGKIFWIFPTPYRDQVMGPFVSRDQYAAFIELVLPLAMFEAIQSRRHKTAYALVAGVLFASVIAGASRAGAILVTLELATLLLLAGVVGHRTGEPSGRLLAKVSAFAVTFTLLVGWGLLWERFHDPDPFKFRREMLASSVAMVRERPWTGFGLGAFDSAYPSFALFDIGMTVNHAHNDWAEWAADGGMPFFLLLAFVAAWAARKAFQAPWGIGVIAVFLHSLVDFPMQKLALAAWVFLLLGALAARDHPDPTGIRGSLR
ncbi:MAG: O-antigen ligase family protein [Bryobacteraceae bacterium]|jgi:O-antigen ligase